MNALWRIELFGGLRAVQGDRVVTRFRTQKTGALLGYVAYYRQQPHPREVLIEHLWPECAPRAGRTSLRVALSSLRHQLEPPGVPAGAVIVASRFTVQLNPAAVTTDVAEFEEAIHRSHDFSRYSDAERIQHLSHAVELYRGELLSGYYENWILPEPQRLEELFFDALDELIACFEEASDLTRAIHYARRGVSVDPLREEAHRELIRLCAAAGQHDAALQQYEELERILKQKLGIAPSAATRALVREIGEQLVVSREQLVLVSGGRSVVSRQKVESVGGESFPRKGQTPEPRPHTAVLQFPVSSHQPSTMNHSRFIGTLDKSEQPSTIGNLPLQFTRFFGREEDIAPLREMLSACQPPNHPTTRLITLTGTGGSGKTRLAIEATGRLRDEFAGGVWFVPLSDISDARLIVDAVRNALRLPRSPHGEPLEQIVDALSQLERHSVRSLLVLDNFEQLAAAGAPVVLTLMKRIPSLTVMLTSRRRLGLPGEREFPVTPPTQPPNHPNAC